MHQHRRAATARTAGRIMVVAPAMMLVLGSFGAAEAFAAQSATGAAHSAAATDAAAAAGANGNGGVGQGNGNGNDAHAPATTPQASDTATSHGSDGTAGTSGAPSSPQPVSNADANSGGANGQCPGGPYCSTRGTPPTASGNGNGGGKAVGKPCAGCVGKADNKNPKGQMPNGSDHNAGYECDRNHGIGRTNPAHTGCTMPTTPQNPPTPPGPPTPPAPPGPPSVGATGSETGPGMTGTTPGSASCAPSVANGFCSTVLGEKQTRTPSTPTPSVIGERVVRTPSALPFTGAPVAVLLLGATAGLGLGCGLLLLGRRRATHH